MESSSSHIPGDDGEGCNSSESGWTMYLASPMHGDDGSGSGKGSGSEGSSVDDGYGYINGRRRSGKAYEDYADDDSLASDASTGPAKVKAPSSLLEGGKDEDDEGRGKNGDGGHGGANEDDDEEDEDGGRTRFSTGSRKKSGKVDKGGGEGKSSRRGHSKKGTSSRRSFFFW